MFNRSLQGDAIVTKGANENRKFPLGFDNRRHDSVDRFRRFGHFLFQRLLLVEYNFWRQQLRRRLIDNKLKH
jgi:hypothetical protein